MSFVKQCEVRHFQAAKKRNFRCQNSQRVAVRCQKSENSNREMESTRRSLLAGCAFSLPAFARIESRADDDFEKMEGIRGKDYGKSRMRVPDYVKSSSGLQYQDLITGKGDDVQEGNTLLIDWDGYTIGYYGRPFEARNKTKGGAFVGDDKDFYKVTLGAHKVIPGFEEALYGMKVGGIRRFIVPVELGYPNNDFNTLGPKPSTFSGKRALDFVLKNQGLIDKTLLFDIEVIRILS
ncbi:hypothetical protein BSKO_13393 [Bryopsis sp. KO-2023]|nr:hypothetical protein BSKO_13393 [Bryopsis sp. KO-2023]